MKSPVLLFVALGTLTLSMPDARGQAKIVPEGDVSGASEKDIEGLNPALAVSGTLNLVNNTNVVGQVEGTSVLLGFGLAGTLDAIKGKRVWRTSLTLNEGFARTPVVDAFIKTNDELALATNYSYFFAPKLGFFVRGKAQTAIFSARAITADPETYLINSAEEGGASETVTADDLKVASAFKPLTLSYSGGIFAQPLSAKSLTLRVRGGLGGRHTIASDVLVNADVDTTEEIELQELANVHQLGFELYAGVEGKLSKDDRVTYNAGASLLVPFVNNDDFDRSFTELTRLAFEASVRFGVFDWMSIVYQSSYIYDPQLFPKDNELSQFQNSLLFTFQYTLIDRQKGLAEMEKQAAIDKAQKEKEEAERKQKEAEERARQLEQELEEAKRQQQQTAPDGTNPAGTSPDGTNPSSTNPDSPTQNPSGTTPNN